MTSKRELVHQSLRTRLYAAYRYGEEIMMVDVDDMAVLLGLEPPEDDEPDMDTAELSQDAIFAIARRDFAEDDTQPCYLPTFDDIDVGD